MKPDEDNLSKFPLDMTTDHLSLFQLPPGLKMLWEAWRMKPNEGEETQREVEEEVRR